MFRQPVSRNHRNKGSKVRRLLQASVLVVVVVWLLYETRHTYESRKGNAEAVSIKHSDGNADVYVSRKANPGSQGGVSTSLSGRNFYETNEVTEIDREDKAAEEAFKMENEESHVHTTDSGEEEGKEGKTDDSTDSRTAEEEVIRLPSETDDSTDHSTSEDGANSGKGEATSSNEEDSRSTNEAVSIREENTEVLMDKEVHDGETAEPQGDTSADTESTSNTTFEQDTTNPGSDGGDSSSSIPNEQDNTESSTVEAFEKDKVDSIAENDEVVPTGKQAENASESDKNGNRSVEAATNDTSEAQNTNLPKSTEEHDEAMQDSNGAPQGEENKIKVESVSESQTTVSSTEAATTDTSSEGENFISANSNGENNAVMSDNNGAPKEDEVEPQAEHGSEGDSKSNANEQKNAEKNENSEGEQNSAEKTDNNEKSSADEQNNAEKTDNNETEQNNAEKTENNEQNSAEKTENKEKPTADEQTNAEKTENNETEQNNAEKTENNEGEQNSEEKTENKEKPIADEQTNAEKTENNETEQNNAEKNENSEASGKDTIESKGSNASDKDEEATTTDEVANAAVTNKDEHLELPANGEDSKPVGVGSSGDAAIEGENSGNESVEGAKPESDGENQKTSDTSTNENAHEETRAEPDSNGVADPSVDN